MANGSMDRERESNVLQLKVDGKWMEKWREMVGESGEDERGKCTQETKQYERENEWDEIISIMIIISIHSSIQLSILSYHPLLYCKFDGRRLTITGSKDNDTKGKECWIERWGWDVEWKQTNWEGNDRTSTRISVIVEHFSLSRVLLKWGEMHQGMMIMIQLWFKHNEWSIMEMLPVSALLMQSSGNELLHNNGTWDGHSTKGF